MPRGYLVSLGDFVLDNDDGIGGGYTFFTTDTVLGNGTWEWSGTYRGTTYTDQTEPGVYYLSTDGAVYFVPDYGRVSSITEATVTDAPSFTTRDGIIRGTGQSELIDDQYVDNQGDAIDDGFGGGPDGNNDTVFANNGDDTIESGLGDDLVYGEKGDDSILGGTGNDELYGDRENDTTDEILNWSEEGSDGTDLTGGFTQNTGEMNVSVSFTSLGNNQPDYTVETSDTIYTTGSETFDDSSSLLLFGTGDGDTSRTTIDFAASAGSDAGDEVENVLFRISDIDWSAGNHEDLVTINAYDAQGNLVDVDITPGANDTVLNNTITAGEVSEDSSDATGSALVSIEGPVASIVIDYANGLGGSQGIWVSNVHFDAVYVQGGDDYIDGEDGDDLLYGQQGLDTLLGGDGDDTLDGGIDADSLVGGIGNDSINVSHGDTAEGGDGDDIFLLIDLGEDNTDTINIVGGEGAETDGDILYLDTVGDPSTIVFTNTDDANGGYTGSFQLFDGTVVNFAEIEDIFDDEGESLLPPICFTPGTLILTQHGERPVETLKAGDLVLTKDDGLQPIRWIGASETDGTGDFAPVRLSKEALDGAQRDLLVSPQHRFLMDNWMNELLFGDREVFASATHLEDGNLVRREPCEKVTYVHMMLDRHQVVFAEGVATESFYAGDVGVAAMSATAREAMFRAFPHLREDLSAYGATARPCLRRHEVELLRASNRQTPPPLWFKAA
ncbi:Hint domain-containing protein [Shimia thalassica]|uniref:Hint domain-containing protein n=1 Tax=Shimia thalassica TaxID=1715693 RepID=UPI001C09A796|nr:Hint domain-containing protein [Shimia thalassica]MBU2944459.1 Hint domain-containing protein [Shimia thalassica]MDO6502195.1 Hint domain-containing protein [Shimia thalassica]